MRLFPKVRPAAPKLGPAAAPRARSRAARAACFCLLAAAACGRAPTGAPAPARNVFPGFDTARFPGEALMRSWRTTSPYQWVGYYLPSPCHRQTTWVGKRQLLEDLGWGIAVLYVGQQFWEGRPPADSLAGTPIICSSSLLTEEQGQRDARDAIAKAASEGFPNGSIIFLDVERVQTVPPSLLAYYRAWQREVMTDGRYLPGTYAHQANTPPLHEVAQAVFREAGRTDTPPFWIAGGRDFRLDSPPWAVGLPYALIWQGALDVQRTWGGSTLPVDENVASRRYPSAPPQ